LPGYRHRVLDPDLRAPYSRLLPWVLVIAGVLGTVAALALTLEKLSLLEDPTYVPTCSINPIVNCGSIMKTDQAEVLGFPNPLIGLMTFPVLIATGAALLAGARFRAWYWIGLQVGTTAGLLFVVWLIHQSLYVIGALCPYCMVAWVAVLAAFWYVTLTNLSAWSRTRDRRTTARLLVNHAVVLTAAHVLIVALIIVRFWDYWSGRFS
jgi:uncharacterized membrane protein